MSKVKHGHARGGARGRTRTYRIWQAMRRRCSDPSYDSYPLYGQRGIRVCAEWENFSAFLRDMGECPTGLSIDRERVNGNYEPGNCKWATQTQQQNNRTNNHKITHNGLTLNLMQWAARTGLPQSTIRKRIQMRWPVEQVLGLPAQHCGYKIRRNDG